VKGIFARHGVEPETLWTQGTGETLQAVVSGAVDVGISLGTSGVMAAFAKGAPVRPIGNSMTGADDLFWYVKADSPLKSLREAAGKSIAYSSNGSSSHLAVLAFQRHFGAQMKLTPAGGPPAVLTQVMSNQIDIGWSTPPFAVEDIKQGKLRLLARLGDVPEFKDQTIRMMVSSLPVIEGKEDLLARFLAAWRETVDWMYAGDEVFPHYARHAQIDPALAKEIRDSYYPKRNLDLARVSGLDNAMRDGIEMKFLTQALTSEQMSELLRFYAK
jgi:NitT/TauT family transport system substrate-binding protein